MPHKRLLRALDQFPPRVLAVVLVLLAALTVGYVWWSTARFSEFVECQAEWGGDLIDYQVDLDEAREGERTVVSFEQHILNRLVEDLIDPDIDNDTALARWQEQHEIAEERRTDLEDDRERNPLPEPPLSVCDGGAVEGVSQDEE